MESRSDPRWGVVWLPQFLDRAAPTSELAVLFGDRVTDEYLARLTAGWTPTFTAAELVAGLRQLARNGANRDAAREIADVADAVGG